MTTAVVGPFLLTLSVSFLVGIGLRQYYEAERKFDTFGTVRTFVFIGLLGFVLFQLPLIGAQAYLAGFGALTLFLLLYYGQKLVQKKSPGLIGVTIALLTYASGPIALHLPSWYLVLIAVSILFVLHSKGRIRRFTDRLETGEVVTAATFLTIVAVALPLIPSVTADVGIVGRIFTLIPVTPRQIWLAVVVTTAISYFGYVLQTYLYPKKGLILTGLIGGVYSSTAAVVVLAKKSRRDPSSADDAAQAILLAVSMMYVRLLALVVIFQPSLALTASAPMLVPAAAAAGYALWLRRRQVVIPADAGIEIHAAAEPELRRNPLELSAAAVFAIAFVVVAWMTRAVLESFRETGLRALSFVVGFSDITPFVVSLLQGGLGLGAGSMLQAMIIASASNNLLKTAYTFGLGSRKTFRLTAPALIGLAVISLVYAAFLA
jgi:uncharacterized membrane protein (DUF4010 family)